MAAESAPHPESPVAHALDRETVYEGYIKGLNPPSDWKEARQRVRNLRQLLHGEFIERDDAIDAVLAALIARVGCVLLGPPGTAKSMLARRIAEHCRPSPGMTAVAYFEYLLTSHTMPEELFGPTDIGKLMQTPPEVVRKSDGRLPHAELAFLDEVFRGGSHILNTLLTILNERRYHNGQHIQRVPLIGFIGAANHPPQSEELAAFFDRFPVRIWVAPVLDKRGDGLRACGMRLILSDAAARSAGALHGAAPGAGRPSTKAKAASPQSTTHAKEDGTPPTLDDFRALHAVVRIHRENEFGTSAAQQGTSQRLSEFAANFSRFKSHGKLSDRAFIQLWHFARALDLVRGQQVNDSFAQGGRGHYHCFKYIAATAEGARSICTQVDQLIHQATHTGA